MVSELSHVHVLEANNLTKAYGGSPALNDVSFTIGAGEIFALLGPNGAGKTTLLRILTGILLPDQGSFRFLGSGDLDAIRDKVGYLPEERGLYKREKIGDTLTYLAELKGLSRGAARERTRHVLEKVGMAAHFDSRPESLSKGMAQRVQIAAAFVHDPPFVILDEPFSGLDPVSARQAQQMVRDERDRGRTILLSTHQMEPVERLADRLLMLYRGRSVLYGSIAEVRAQSVQGIVAVTHTEDALLGFAPPNGAERLAAERCATTFQLSRALSARSLVAALIATGVEITGFSSHQPSLEEIFLATVGASE